MATMNKMVEQIPGSPLVVDILDVLSQEEMYAKEIAEKIGAERKSVSNYLQALRKTGLVERGKRNKAQYYLTTEKGQRFLELKDKKSKIDEKIQEIVYTS